MACSFLPLFGIFMGYQSLVNKSFNKLMTGLAGDPKNDNMIRILHSILNYVIKH